MGMGMPKKNRVAIYEHLFKEGVMVAEKDFHAPKHPELETIPNLQVIKALTSLKRALPRGNARPARTAAPRPGGDKPEGDRAAYRKAPGGEDKAGAAGPGSAPMEFRGGFGRGKPAQ